MIVCSLRFGFVSAAIVPSASLSNEVAWYAFDKLTEIVTALSLTPPEWGVFGDGPTCVLAMVFQIFGHLSITKVVEVMQAAGFPIYRSGKYGLALNVTKALLTGNLLSVKFAIGGLIWALGLADKVEAFDSPLPYNSLSRLVYQQTHGKRYSSWTLDEDLWSVVVVLASVWLAWQLLKLLAYTVSFSCRFWYGCYLSLRERSRARKLASLAVSEPTELEVEFLKSTLSASGSLELEVVGPAGQIMKLRMPSAAHVPASTTSDGSAFRPEAMKPGSMMTASAGNSAALSIFVEVNEELHYVGMGTRYKGFLVTAAHVLEGKERVVVESKRGTRVEVAVPESHRYYDDYSAVRLTSANWCALGATSVKKPNPAQLRGIKPIVTLYGRPGGSSTMQESHGKAEIKGFDVEHWASTLQGMSGTGLFYGTVCIGHHKGGPDAKNQPNEAMAFLPLAMILDQKEDESFDQLEELAAAFAREHRGRGIRRRHVENSPYSIVEADGDFVLVSDSIWHRSGGWADEVEEEFGPREEDPRPVRRREACVVGRANPRDTAPEASLSDSSGSSTASSTHGESSLSGWTDKKRPSAQELRARMIAYQELEDYFSKSPVHKLMPVDVKKQTIELILESMPLPDVVAITTGDKEVPSVKSGNGKAGPEASTDPSAADKLAAKRERRRAARQRQAERKRASKNAAPEVPKVPKSSPVSPSSKTEPRSRLPRPTGFATRESRARFLRDLERPAPSPKTNATLSSLL